MKQGNYQENWNNECETNMISSINNIQDINIRLERNQNESNQLLQALSTNQQEIKAQLEDKINSTTVPIERLLERLQQDLKISSESNMDQARVQNIRFERLEATSNALSIENKALQNL